MRARKWWLRTSSGTIGASNAWQRFVRKCALHAPSKVSIAQMRARLRIVILQNAEGKDCGITLTLKTVFAHKGKIYCKSHVPRPKKTDVADDVLTRGAKKAQDLKTHSREERFLNPTGYKDKHTAVVDDVATVGAKKAQELKRHSREERSQNPAGYEGRESQTGGQATTASEPSNPVPPSEVEAPTEEEPEAAAPETATPESAAGEEGNGQEETGQEEAEEVVAAPGLLNASDDEES